MPDVEKVIRGLERCIVCNTSVIASAEGEKAYRDCEYTVALYCRQDKLLRDALELLKEQEAVEPEVEVLNEIDRLYRCPRCHKHFFYEKQKYCDQCGQAVKWNG